MNLKLEKLCNILYLIVTYVDNYVGASYMFILIMDKVRNYTISEHVYNTIFYKIKYSSYKSSRTQFECTKIVRTLKI